METSIAIAETIAPHGRVLVLSNIGRDYSALVNTVLTVDNADSCLFKDDGCWRPSSRLRSCCDWYPACPRAGFRRRRLHLLRRDREDVLERQGLCYDAGNRLHHPDAALSGHGGAVPRRGSRVSVADLFLQAVDRRAQPLFAYVLATGSVLTRAWRLVAAAATAVNPYAVCARVELPGHGGLQRADRRCRWSCSSGRREAREPPDRRCGRHRAGAGDADHRPHGAVPASGGDRGCGDAWRAESGVSA